MAGARHIKKEDEARMWLERKQGPDHEHIKKEDEARMWLERKQGPDHELNYDMLKACSSARGPCG